MATTNQPLADRIRPQHIHDVVGQNDVLGTDGPLGRMVASGQPASFILWGPPGCGKTTLAKIMAQQFNLHFEQLSAVFSGVADLRKVFESAKIRRQNGTGTVLFVDEIHRFNRSQQDAFLPYVEDGTIILIGATTENPSFELNSALLSRCPVVVLNRLDEAALEQLLQRAEKSVGRILPLDDETRHTLLRMADGDGRYLLNCAETLLNQKTDSSFTPVTLQKFLNRRAPLYDKSSEGHYNLISALHKAVRGSDANAALYWLARMLDGGEDPGFIARRMVRMAAEDIGLADPAALQFTLSAWDAYERLGSPEGDLMLSQAILYLATAPKSNAVYTAHKAAHKTAHQTGSLPPPPHILNAPTQLMKDIGYGVDYQYDHDAPHAFSGQNYFPDNMKPAAFYHPVERGFERDIIKRLDYWDKLRKERRA